MPWRAGMCGVRGGAPSEPDVRTMGMAGSSAGLVLPYLDLLLIGRPRAARACAGAVGEARAQNRIESSSVLVGMSWGLSSLHVPCREPQREGGWAGG